MKFEDYQDSGKEVDYHLKAELELKWTLPSVNRHTLIFPRGVTRLCLEELNKDPNPHQLTASGFAFCLPNIALNLQAMSLYGRVAILQPSAARWEEHLIENELGELAMSKIRQTTLRSFRLTKWLDELVDRYDFERRLNSRTPAQCPFFVEKQILNEVIRILCPEEVPTTGELVGTEKTTISSEFSDGLTATFFKTSIWNQLPRK